MTHALFQRIESIIPTIDGWCSPERACELAALVVGLKPKVTCCLGVWGGRDTFALALAHQHNGFGRVLAIDPFAAAASVDGQAGANLDWWSSQERHEIVLDRFTKNIDEFGLRQWIEFRRAKSSEVQPPDEIGALIVDGNHGPESISDVEKWAPRVVLGGVTYCDDIHWDGGAVAQAVEQLRKMGFVQLYERDSGAFFQRIK